MNEILSKRKQLFELILNGIDVKCGLDISIIYEKRFYIFLSLEIRIETTTFFFCQINLTYVCNQ